MDERLKRDLERRTELQRKVDALPAPTGPDPALVAAEGRAKEAYLASLASLYAAEREAGMSNPPAPHDPAASKDAYAKGARVKLDAVVVDVRKRGTRTEVRLARGAGADPSAWKDQVSATTDGDFAFAPGSVVALEAMITPGKDSWRILGVAAKK